MCVTSSSPQITSCQLSAGFLPADKAVWRDNQNIGSPEVSISDKGEYSHALSFLQVLRAVLEEGGFPAEELLAKASSKQIKQKLFTNTERSVTPPLTGQHVSDVILLLLLIRAEESGLCGVPSFQVNDGPVVWGQDRLNVVQDMLCGWQQPDLSSKL